MFLVDLDEIYYEDYKGEGNLKFKICKDLDDVNDLADFISKLEFKERTFLFVSNYNEIVCSNVKLMNIINSKKDNLRVVVFCDQPSKLNKEDVSSFDYAMQLDFTELCDDFFGLELIDLTDCDEDHYPAIYDLNNIGSALRAYLNPFVLFDLIFYDGKLFNNDIDIEKLFPGFYNYFTSFHHPIQYEDLLYNYRINFFSNANLITIFDLCIDVNKDALKQLHNSTYDSHEFSSFTRELLLLDEERLYKFFDIYYRFAKDFYKKINSFCSLKESMYYLDSLSYEVLCACSKYYYSINDIEKANLMLYLSIYAFVRKYFKPRYCYLLHHNNYEKGFGERFFRILNDFKEHLSSIKDYIYNDWCSMCPRITYFIGKYYLHLNDKKEAYSWFNLGSNLNYEGRQSDEPFNELSRNMYEKVLLLLEDKDYVGCEEVLNTFPLRTFRPLPIESEIIPNYINENDLEEVEDYKFKCYLNFNPSFKDVDVYLGFQYLDEEQKEEFERILNKKIAQANNDEEVKLLERLKHRLTDEDWVIPD